MKRHSACNENGLSATAIATNALVKDLCVIIAGSKIGLHRATINIVHRRSDNKNIMSAHHQAEGVDRANNLHHSWQVPKCHETNARSVKE
jgi:hypothetical protein